MSSVFSPSLPTDGYHTCYWQGLNGSAESLALVQATIRAEGPILLVCDSNESVEKYLRELIYLSSELKAHKVFALPDWETLPYDIFSPHQDIISDRLATLFSLPTMERGIVVTSISSLMHLLPPRQYIDANSLDLTTGQKKALSELREQMVIAGYQHVTTVMEHGEFAVRGSIVDIYPMGTALPLRIDLFDDEIDSIRRFDPETQRSAATVERVHLLPGREFPLDEPGIIQFRKRFRERFDVDIRQCPIYQDVSDGIASPGLEYYLDVLFEKHDSLFDFLPDETTICKAGKLRQAGEKFWADVLNRYEDRQFDRYRPILSPEQVFIPVNEIFSRLKSYRQVEFKTHPQAMSFASEALPELASNSRAEAPLSAVKEFVNSDPGRVLFTAETAGRRETLLELLRQVDLNPVIFDHWQHFVDSNDSLGISVAQIDRGLWLTNEKLLIIPEAQIFQDRVAQRRRRKRD
ncbi:MAG: transcription-repair coupling factor, partial [Pseudomonadota bacterium]|nr:transcription-repair coupling factor [Pseudomonadota bacterium]